MLLYKFRIAAAEHKTVFVPNNSHVRTEHLCKERQGKKLKYTYIPRKSHKSNSVLHLFWQWQINLLSDFSRPAKGTDAYILIRRIHRFSFIDSVMAMSSICQLLLVSYQDLTMLTYIIKKNSLSYNEM